MNATNTLIHTEATIFPEGLSGVVDDQGNPISCSRQEHTADPDAFTEGRRVRVILQNTVGEIALVMKNDVQGNLIAELPGGKVKRKKPKVDNPEAPPSDAPKWKNWRKEAVRELEEEVGSTLDPETLNEWMRIQEIRAATREYILVRVYTATLPTDAPIKDPTWSEKEKAREARIEWKSLAEAICALEAGKTRKYKEAFGRQRDLEALRAYQKTKVDGLAA